MSKLAVIFPGIGYHTDKPLLYYGKKLCASYGYEIREVPYQNFRRGIKGNAEKMKEAFESALEQTRELLLDVRWEEADEILFLSKSIGTVVASAYAKEKELRVRHVFFTPLEETFLAAEASGGHMPDAIAFHGTDDPWAEDEPIEEACRRLDIPLTQIPGANHSLETGDVRTDLENLTLVLGLTERWITGGSI